MKTLLNQYYRLLVALLTILITGMIIVVSMQVFARFSHGFIPRYLWTEEASRFCFVWIIMLGSAIAVRDGTHFEVDLLPEPKSKRGKGVSDLIVHLAMILMAFLFVRYGYDFAKFGFYQTSEISSVNMLTIYAAFPIAGVSWVLFLLEHIAKDLDLISGHQEGEAS